MRLMRFERSTEFVFRSSTSRVPNAGTFSVRTTASRPLPSCPELFTSYAKCVGFRLNVDPNAILQAGCPSLVICTVRENRRLKVPEDVERRAVRTDRLPAPGVKVAIVSAMLVANLHFLQVAASCLGVIWVTCGLLLGFVRVWRK